MSAKNESNSNLYAVLSYLSILSLVMLLLKKDDKYVIFHARQGFILFAVSLVGFVPGVGWLAFLGAVALAIVGMIKAAQGEEYSIPVVGELSKKINL